MRTVARLLSSRRHLLGALLLRILLATALLTWLETASLVLLLAVGRDFESWNNLLVLGLLRLAHGMLFELFDRLVGATENVNTSPVLDAARVEDRSQQSTRLATITVDVASVSSGHRRLLARGSIMLQRRLMHLIVQCRLRYGALARSRLVVTGLIVSIRIFF